MVHCDKVFFIFVILSHSFRIAKSEVFTSIVDLEPLLYTERAIAKTLDDYINLEEQRLNQIKILKAEFKRLYEAASKDVETFLAHPVNAFLLVKHLSADLERVKFLTEAEQSKAIIENFLNRGFHLPDEEDLPGAAVALMRLQDTYLLNTTELAQGRIRGATMSSKLNAHDCFELGFRAYEKEDDYHAGLWFEEALNQWKAEKVKTYSKSVILEFLANVYFMVNEKQRAIKLVKEILLEEPGNFEANQNLEYFQSRLTPAEKKQSYLENTSDTNRSLDSILRLRPSLNPYFGDYNKLCRGERVRSPIQEKELYCRYTTNNSSYFLLQPAKEEVLSFQPRIVIYHNVISDKDAELFKTLAIPMLDTAKISNPSTAKLESATYRVSKSAWMHDGYHPRVERASKMIQELTNLDASTAEPMHIIHYGIGGHYDPHYDYTRPGEADAFAKFGTGNRIATWIYYLSDVEAGGSTVFPDIGVEVKAEKGAACLWYNLWRNGTGDLATKHAACPVLAGKKWVANKWFHESGQEFRRPCALNQAL